ncbi:type IV pilus secretin PilQ [Trinickia caryophylli]|nr:type IV pilus secretin PilQ [Trinickia caryophylli]WQE13647.1 type IV pilus secretin PilQ [Trinickia caryophylli]
MREHTAAPLDAGGESQRAAPVAELDDVPPGVGEVEPGDDDDEDDDVGLALSSSRDARAQRRAPDAAHHANEAANDAAEGPSGESEDRPARQDRLGQGLAPLPEAQPGASAGVRLEGPPVPLAPAPRLSAGAAGGRPRVLDDAPITMHFREASLADVLDAFARFTGLNIVASERARGPVTLFLNDVPWRTAFDTLLDAKGLAMTRRGNVIWVAPVAELAARERQRFEAHARAADLEPLASRTFVLRYPRAEDVQRLLTAAGAQRVLSKRGAAMADARTNLLFVTDLDARLAQVARLVEAIDKPNRQVLIEARIVEGARGFSRDLGARLSVRAAAAANGAGREAAGLGGGGANGLVHDLAARGLGGFEAATAGLTLFAARATRLVTAELSALEAEGRGQLVSSPRIVTADRMKATVEQGTELPYQAKVRNGVSGVQFRRATLRLDVEPQITPNGRVVLDLDIAKDSVGEATAAGPAIDTKRVRTRVEIEDGGTVSIGGIYEQSRRDDVTRVPVLGKIPLLGALFRHRMAREQTSELVVFITPRVIGADQ